MSLLHELEDSLKSDAPCYMDFLYRYDPKKKQVFAFYEGDEDSSYYHHLIKKRVGNNCELEEIVAGCKNNVLKLQREFDWHAYDKKQIVFFVDRDLSYWLDESSEYGENVYVTDEYSVENYIVNPIGFNAWLVHFEGFARANKHEIDYMITEFESTISKFKRIMIPIMAQAIVAKRHDCSISLSDYKITTDKTIRFKIDNGHIDFDFIADQGYKEKWGLSELNSKEIDDQIECISTEFIHYSVRGKWILHFMAQLGEYMRLHSDVFAPSLGSKGKVSPTCSVPPAQCLSVLAPYCAEYYPPRLLTMLNNSYMLYLKSAS